MLTYADVCCQLDEGGKSAADSAQSDPNYTSILLTKPLCLQLDEGGSRLQIAQLDPDVRAC